MFKTLDPLSGPDKDHQGTAFLDVELKEAILGIDAGAFAKLDMKNIQYGGKTVCEVSYSAWGNVGLAHPPGKKDTVQLAKPCGCFGVSDVMLEVAEKVYGGLLNISFARSYGELMADIKNVEGKKMLEAIEKDRN